MPDRKRTFRNATAAVGPALLLLAFLWYPIARLIALHLTLTGACEESLGYRYFYSLRLLYDPDGYVFLPQGQLMDLFNQATQMVLTALGYPINSVFPRIDLFSYASITVAQFLGALAFYYAFRYLKSLPARLALALVAVVPFFNVPISGFTVILTPDYMLWILPVMLVTAGAILRAFDSSGQSWSQRDSWMLATLVAAGMGLKATLTIYPITLAIVLLIKRRDFLESSIQAVTAVVLGILGWLVILLIYYHGHWSYILRYFVDEMGFGSSLRSEISYLQWTRAILLSGPWLVRCSVALPFALVALLAATRDRSRVAVLCGVLAGALIYHAFLFLRNTPVTWFEAANYLMMTVIVVPFGITIPFAPRLQKTFLGLIMVTVAVQVFSGFTYLQNSYFPYLKKLNLAQQKAGDALRPFQDKVAFLLPDNSYRPLTIDSDVFKGGSNILDGPHFGKSKLVRSFFPSRDYFSDSTAFYSSNPIDLRSFSAVVFVVRKGIDPEPAGQLAAMCAHYGPGLGKIALVANIDFGDQEFLIWSVPGNAGSLAP